MSMRTEQAHATANGVAKKEQANGHAKGHELSAEESEAMKDSFESHEPVGPPVYGEKKLDCSDAGQSAQPKPLHLRLLLSEQYLNRNLLHMQNGGLVLTWQQVNQTSAACHFARLRRLPQLYRQTRAPVSLPECVLQHIDCAVWKASMKALSTT